MEGTFDGEHKRLLIDSKGLRTSLCLWIFPMIPLREVEGKTNRLDRSPPNPQREVAVGIACKEKMG
jgi:hypothetical protein